MNNETKNNQIIEQPKNITYTIKNFIQENILVFIIALLCLIYISKGVITLSSNEKSFGDVLTDSALGLIMGISLSILLGDYGIVRGRKNKVYLHSKKLYGLEVEKCDKYIQYCDEFCIEKNEELLRIKKKNFLRKYSISYDDYINNRLDLEKLTERKKVALEEVETLEVFQLDTEYLLSDCDDDNQNADLKKKYNINNYKRRKYSGIGIRSIFISLLFGMYAVKLTEAFSWANVIWYVIQVVMWLVLGFITFLSNYDYIVETYRQNVIIKKTNFLIEFHNLMEEDPNRYKKEIVIDVPKTRKHELIEHEEEQKVDIPITQEIVEETPTIQVEEIDLTNEETKESDAE